jgi:hypothetical protein
MKKAFLFVVVLLLALVRINFAQEFSISRPEWLIGDTWTWTVKGSLINNTVLGSKTIRGFEAYEVSEGATKISYFTKDLSPIQVVDKNGKILYLNDPPMKHWVWPLTPNKKWSFTVYWRDKRSGDSNTITHWAKVESKSLEKVKVPAGEFETVKVGREAGAWRYEYWYSPEIKNYVKWTTYRSDGTIVTNELFDYKLGGPVENFLIKEPVVWPLQPKGGEYFWIIFKFSSPSDPVRLEGEVTYQENAQLVTRQSGLDFTKTEQKFEGKTSGTILYRWRFSTPGKRDFKIWVIDKQNRTSNTITLPIEIQ